jgi:hypothetical protein|tara:strand:- start:254 stop:466 length:213 start_codon:yes stop_codon:yes gene_type:complete
MKTKNTDEYRGEVMTHLAYIKEKVDANFEHLERVNGRLNRAENDIVKLKTIGLTLFTILTVAISLVGILQ